jgi:hypothetical protein
MKMTMSLQRKVNRQDAKAPRHLSKHSAAEHDFAPQAIVSTSRVMRLMAGKKACGALRSLGALASWWFMPALGYGNASKLATWPCPPTVAAKLKELGSC